ncbi:glucokinase [Crocosphaera subtropica ATCC 51142]|uniref:Glucokinase n=1 Tax=Crocosphaera subtropica (strain ATCC 51142 / BH68) TaxID=43989 RepID=A1KYH1_CROS5|nr:glucokinase [Crocosphaera subtropica]AAW57024.1 glucokinase [Crocosphaera subtropica ATCC 51142]ACB49946.1 glucokinase [Crocosphaera subtropica ATCC 51142]
MTVLLAGDIGGTKTILRLVNSEQPKNGENLPQQTTLYEKSYPSQNYDDLVPIVQEFLKEAKQELEQEITIKNGCFGIAGPVVNNTSELTNLSWSLTGDRLEKQLSLERVNLINDFAAIGYGILGLEKDDLYILQDMEPKPNTPMAVLGAGTGLGECFLTPLESGIYEVFSSEGSHGDFAPRNELEFELLTYIQDNYNLPRVSIERIVSGMGISAIYQFLRHKYPEKESEKFKEIYQAWESKQKVDLSAEVSKAAMENNDALCQQTMELFISAYGAEAGNLALKILPYGGLYVAGGIAAKILPLLKKGSFIEAFKAKGRMSSLLAQMPVYVILNPKVGLIGAALRAAR